MNFTDLHELLRVELAERIARGTLTRSALAGQTGFRQAHISNFLNRKRSLSLDGLDRMLASQNLTIDQILPVEFMAASTAQPCSDPMEVVPVVSAIAAMEEARIGPKAIIETLPVSASRLADYRSRPSPRRAHWQRFVAIRVDAEQAFAMHPVLSPGAVVVLDRHYNSLARYRAQQPTLYAVRSGGALLIRFVDLDGARLILRPNSISCSVHLIGLGVNEAPADYLVGRVCLVFSEM